MQKTNKTYDINLTINTENILEKKLHGEDPKLLYR